MELKQIFATNIRKLRIERGLTQEQLSELAGINRNYTGMIEREQCSVTLDMLEKVAKALKIRPVELLDPGLKIGADRDIR